MTETGAVLATWSRYPADGPSRVEVAERPAGGAWRPATLLPSGKDGLDPVIATGQDGAAVVAWRRFSADAPQPHRGLGPAGRRGVGGRPQSSPRGPTCGSRRSSWTTPARRPWRGSSGRTAGPSCAARRDPVAGWLPAQTLSAAAEKAAEPALGVAGDGAVTAVWTRLDGTNKVRGSRLG